jgi:hypothetical protein
MPTDEQLRTGHHVYDCLPNVVVYVPRWSSDHHPWLAQGMDPKIGIRYSNAEVEEEGK